MTALPDAFRRLPLAHRGYHDRAMGQVENSLGAVQAAIDAGYGIELDVQRSADNRAMVFHDAALDRLTEEKGPLRARDAAALGRIPLRGSTDRIPTLFDVLCVVSGQVPVLIEIKDQDGALGPRVGPLEHAVCDAIAGYSGPLAVMSFNPYSVAVMADLAPDVPRGLTTCAFRPADWDVPVARLSQHRAMDRYASGGCGFVSHAIDDLDSPRVSSLKAQGATILCWTVTSAEAEARARRIAHNITFEGYAAPLP